MNKWLFPIVATAVLFMGCDDISEEETVSDDGGTLGLQIHHQGEACLSCHNSGGSQDPALSAAGTVFTDVNADNSATALYAVGYTMRIILEDSAKTVINFSAGNGSANSKVFASTAVSTSFTAQVVNASGTVVNSSGLASHTSAQTNCNSCHTSSGTNSAPGRIVNFDISNNLTVVEDDTGTTTTPEANTTTTVVTRSFSTDVMPLFSSCTSCHRVGEEDFVASSDVTITYNSLVNHNLFNTTTPENSWLLLKNDGTNSHSGGVNFSKTSDAYTTLRDWIEQGALNN